MTTRAKVRDAAIMLFARDGFERTTVRQIAAEAGVSAALVIHHFGGKEQLRHACDDHILATWFTEQSAFTSGSVSEAVGQWQANVDRYRPYIDYFSLMINDGTPGGDRLFDRMVSEVEVFLAAGVAAGQLNESSDPEMLALVITMYGLAPLLMRAQLARVLGDEAVGEALAKRMTIPVLELYTHGLYADNSLLTAAREALGGTIDTRRTPKSDKGENDPNQDPDPPVNGSSN